jgi:hypothetical protein
VIRDKKYKALVDATLLKEPLEFFLETKIENPEPAGAHFECPSLGCGAETMMCADISTKSVRAREGWKVSRSWVNARMHEILSLS